MPDQPNSRIRNSGRRRAIKTLAASSASMLTNGVFGRAFASSPPAKDHRLSPIDERTWERLNSRLGGRLIPVNSPLLSCRSDPKTESCETLFSQQLRNPYFIHDEAALTQTLGWVDAWTSEPSVYAVEVLNAEDVAACVEFARRYGIRLAVKGGGHSYHGNSNAANSLLIWTRRMTEVSLQSDFVPMGCAGTGRSRNNGTP